jgi:hypothetical protein
MDDGQNWPTTQFEMVFNRGVFMSIRPDQVQASIQKKRTAEAANKVIIEMQASEFKWLCNPL